MDFAWSCLLQTEDMGFRTLRCREDLKVDIATGKRLLTTILHGGAIPTRFVGNSLLQSLQKASRYLRAAPSSPEQKAIAIYFRSAVVGVRRSGSGSLAQHRT